MPDSLKLDCFWADGGKKGHTNFEKNSDSPNHLRIEIFEEGDDESPVFGYFNKEQVSELKNFLNQHFSDDKVTIPIVPPDKIA